MSRVSPRCFLQRAGGHRNLETTHHADICRLDPCARGEDLRTKGDHNGARLLFVEGETGEAGGI